MLPVLCEASRTVARVCVVARGPDVRRAGLPRLLRALHHGVDLLHPVEGLGQNHLREAVVYDGLLVVSVLCLPELRRALHLVLEVGNGLLGGLNLGGKAANGLVKVRNPRLQAGLLVVSRRRLPLVGGQLVRAPIPVPHLVGLLILQLGHHLVDGDLHLLEAVQLDLGRQQRQLGVCVLAGGALQHPRSTRAQLLLKGATPRRAGLEQCDVHGLVKVVECLIRVEDLDRILHCGDLLEPTLDPSVKLGGGLRALLLEVRQELTVERQLSLRVVVLLEGLRVLLAVVRDVRVHLRHGLLR
mmetsp:Transcript_115772/g.307836  ORF Transcript_115772/g.307836 Transcript_115772/m.307836 type:complete len:299 (-) Transcript_115772:862-1758(-)